MAVRIREDGTIVCAAMFPELPGDTYIHDGLHHKLSGELGVLVAEPMEKHQHDGRWWWFDEVPADRGPEEYWADVRVAALDKRRKSG